MGSDPTVRYTSTGTAVANFTVASSRNYKTKDGEKKEDTEWMRVVAWDLQGENCGEYLKKGSLVYIEGRLRTREWEDKDGNKRTTTEIVAGTMQMLGGTEKKADDSAQGSGSETNDEGDVPF